MKRKRFTEEQIIAVLKESEAGAKTDDICRRHGISSATFYSWRKMYGSMEAGDDCHWNAIGPSDNGDASASFGSRECQAEADRRGSNAGHVRDEGPAPKTLASPWRSDELWAF